MSNASSNHELTIVDDDNPSADRVQALKAAVGAFNVDRGMPDHEKPLGLIACDPFGALQGGLYGATYWQWLFIEHLWVAQTYRGAGLGSRLLRRGEDVARKCGCVGVCLNTMSFQAPDFYALHDYCEFGRLADVPLGHTRIWFSKHL
jgi:predicted N-acetyltransferase YhbS